MSSNNNSTNSPYRLPSVAAKAPLVSFPSFVGARDLHTKAPSITKNGGSSSSSSSNNRSNDDDDDEIETFPFESFAKSLSSKKPPPVAVAPTNLQEVIHGGDSGKSMLMAPMNPKERFGGGARQRRSNEPSCKKRLTYDDALPSRTNAIYETNTSKHSSSTSDDDDDDDDNEDDDDDETEKRTKTKSPDTKKVSPLDSDAAAAEAAAAATTTTTPPILSSPGGAAAAATTNKRKHETLAEKTIQQTDDKLRILTGIGKLREQFEQSTEKKRKLAEEMKKSHEELESNAALNKTSMAAMVELANREDELIRRTRAVETREQTWLRLRGELAQLINSGDAHASVSTVTAVETDTGRDMDVC